MNKRTSIFSKLAVAVAFAATIASCSQTKTDSKPASAATPDKADIVYVNSDTLLNKYDYFKEMSSPLQEKGYKLVLTFSKANPTVLFGDPSLDVTLDVVKRLNDAYAKDKK